MTEEERVLRIVRKVFEETNKEIDSYNRFTRIAFVAALLVLGLFMVTFNYYTK